MGWRSGYRGRCLRIGRSTQGDWVIYIQAAEHDGAVHSYSPHYVPMPLYGEEVGTSDTDKVVGVGGPGLPKEAGVGGGGWRRRRVWGWRGGLGIGTGVNPKRK